MSADGWATCPTCKAQDQLREDYEFCMFDDGTFLAEYGCHCQACGWKWKFTHKETVVPAKEPPPIPLNRPQG